MVLISLVFYNPNQKCWRWIQTHMYAHKHFKLIPISPPTKGLTELWQMLQRDEKPYALPHPGRIIPQTRLIITCKCLSSILTVRRLNMGSQNNNLKRWWQVFSISQRKCLTSLSPMHHLFPHHFFSPLTLS